jgi:glutamine cyclotransferase
MVFSKLNVSGGTGCSIISPSPQSFGEQFNQQGGGVYAMQWDGDGIKMCRLTDTLVVRNKLTYQGTGSGEMSLQSTWNLESRGCADYVASQRALPDPPFVSAMPYLQETVYRE